MPNRLAASSSPYLQQHKDNPVDWYPWGAEAIARAKAENKPMLVSIGYSACHWCHVMAHESFEDPAVADLMNSNLINIKVDREERPDIDGICMAAVQGMTGQGGWPLNAFLTPDGVPFYGGTYFPPEDRHGMPSWRRVIEAVINAWSTNQAEIVEQGEQVREALSQQLTVKPNAADLDEDTIIRAIARLGTQFDEVNGGFGGAPKFPQAPVLDFALRAHRLLGHDPGRTMAVGTLEAMSEGGIFDQIGGGFHRYAVDAIWLVPHFEKMLYDNAQLARLYTDAWRLTQDPAHKRTAELTLDYLLREMQSPNGAFHSAQDADSEGEEGKFYVWSPDEVRAALPEVEVDLALQAFGITEGGNFEGRSIPTAPPDPLDERIEQIRQQLYDARSERIKPGTDTKIITAWNAMTIRALAEASLAFDRPVYAEAAVQCATFIRTNLVRDGILYRTWDGANPTIPGFLEDYAHLIDALIPLYEATSDLQWIQWAVELTQSMLRDFDAGDGLSFFDTSQHHDALVVRPKDMQDGATPSGNAVALHALIRLGHLTGTDAWVDRATAALGGMKQYLDQQPMAFGRFLAAGCSTLATVREVAIAAPEITPESHALAATVYKRFEPDALVAYADHASIARIPWVADRPIRNGQPTAYLCERFVCLPPVQTPADLTAQLEMGTGMIWTSF